MAYIKKETRAGNRIRIEKHYSSRYGSKGRCVRGANYQKTSEGTAKRNARYAAMRADDVFNENFGAGDLLLTFTFKQDLRPKSKDEVLNIWAKYIRKVRAVYSKEGINLKWMKSVGAVNRGNQLRATHIHAAFSKIDISLLPKWEYGGVHIQQVDDRDYHTFGSYCFEQFKEHEINKDIKAEDYKLLQCYSHSRNCVIPQSEITVISNDHWADEPKAPKGWYVVKESVNNWEDEVNGYKHQSYIICKLPEKPVKSGCHNKTKRKADETI